MAERSSSAASGCRAPCRSGSNCARPPHRASRRPIAPSTHRPRRRRQPLAIGRGQAWRRRPVATGHPASAAPRSRRPPARPRRSPGHRCRHRPGRPASCPLKTAQTAARFANAPTRIASACRQCSRALVPLVVVSTTVLPPTVCAREFKRRIAQVESGDRQAASFAGQHAPRPARIGPRTAARPRSSGTESPLSLRRPAHRRSWSSPAARRSPRPCRRKAPRTQHRRAKSER